MCSACETCPFDHSDAVENAINLGCVPSQWEIMQYKRDLNKNWGCHSADDGEIRLCAGFVRECRTLGLDYRDGTHLSYKDWYEHGPAGTEKS